MTSYLDRHRTTDIRPEILSGVQTGNEIQHDEYDICDDKVMQRRLLQSFTYILEWGLAH